MSATIIVPDLDEMIIKVLTYNIRHGRGLDDQVNTDRIGDVLEESSADLIFLQEVDRGLPRSTFVHQSEQLAHRLHFYFTFHANFGVPFAGMGNAILSRFEIYSTWNKLLPFTGEPRGLLKTLAITPGGPIELFCTHWGLTASQRLKQAQACLSALGKRDDPQIFCGDLNAVITSNEVKELLDSGILFDCGPSSGRTFTSGLPLVKIDYILVSKEFIFKDAKILTSQASDHFPVLATLELPDQWRVLL